MQVQRWRRQSHARQLLAQQALQMAHVQHGLGRAQHQLALGGGVTPGIQGPVQAQCQHARLAQLQPHPQLLEQAARTKQKCGRRLHLGNEFELGLKHLGQHQPGVHLGLVPVSPVKRLQQGRAPAARHAAPRQRTQLAPTGTAQSRQHGQVGPSRCQCAQGQIVRGGVRQFRLLESCKCY